MLLLVHIQLCGDAIQSCLQLFVELFRKRAPVNSVNYGFLLTDKETQTLIPFYLLNGFLFVFLCVQLSKDIICQLLWILNSIIFTVLLFLSLFVSYLILAAFTLAKILIWFFNSSICSCFKSAYYFRRISFDLTCSIVYSNTLGCLLSSLKKVIPFGFSFQSRLPSYSESL
jgi:hypothetical protein